MEARTLNTWVDDGHLLSYLDSQAAQVSDGAGGIVDMLTPVSPRTCVQLLHWLHHHWKQALFIYILSWDHGGMELRLISSWISWLRYLIP